MKRTRTAILGAIFAFFMAVSMPNAFAATLPYTWTFSGLTGGNGGVESGHWADSGAAPCIEKDYIRVSNPYGVTVDSRVNFILYKDVTFGYDVKVATVTHTLGETNSTKCFSATLPSGVYYIKIQKAVYQSYVTLTGRGYVK